jgi:hypothetical protein
MASSPPKKQKKRNFLLVFLDDHDIMISDTWELAPWKRKMEVTMTENTTHTTQLTPAEAAAAALANLVAEYDALLASKKAAEQTLNKTAVEAANAALAQIRTRARELMQIVAPGVKLSDSRCRVLVVHVRLDRRPGPQV